MENEYNLDTIRFISHEIKNQLSICELYAEIIKKTCIKDEIFNMNIMKAIDCIKNSVKMSNNSLIELKSCSSTVLEKHSIALVVEEALGLSSVYGLQKNVKIEADVKTSSHVLVDKLKLIACIINLIKNACEAFEDEPEKKIMVKVYQEGDFIKVIVSNNAKPIEDKSKVFEEGYTTKTTGNGLGLVICKSNLEKMKGELKLLKSDSQSTDFEIDLPRM